MNSMLDNCGMSVENYSRTLIGWANYTSGNLDVPSLVTLGAVGRVYDCVDYVSGQTYNNAGVAREYLVSGTPSWTIIGDTRSPSCPSLTPTPTMTPTITPTPTVTSSLTPTPTITPTRTTTPTPTITPTKTITPTPTKTPVIPQPEFILTVDTRITGGTSSATNRFVLPLNAFASYNFNVNWGDGTSQTVTTSSNVTKTYATPGIYDIKITGTFPRIFFNNTGDRLKVLNVKNWGNIVWSIFAAAFRGCSNMDVTAPDAPILSAVTEVTEMFLSCTSLSGTSAFSSWNVSNIQNFNFMLSETQFNQDVSSWNVANGQLFTALFRGTPFNKPLNSWNMANAVATASMFQNNVHFNQPLNLWNTGKLDTISTMFENATAFNQDISMWNTSTIRFMEGTFRGATAFNQPIGSWNTGNVTTMQDLFQRARVFNQPIGSWNTGNVTIMSGMFNEAEVFNHPINSFNTSKVTNMSVMFQNAFAFNQPVGSWNVSGVTSMSLMFAGAASFNQNIGTWNLRLNGVGMSFMLNSCGMNIENYSRTLIGWANYASANANRPLNVTLNSNGRTYNCINYVTGQTYNNAVVSRSYLDVGAPNWSISGDAQVGTC
jgi:surface protein